MGRHPYLVSARTAEAATRDAGEEEAFRKIIALLRSNFGVDFTHYRDTTIKRRAMRRMVLQTKDTLADYARQLEADRPELQALYQDILINVTSFFRDPEMLRGSQDQRLPGDRQEQIAGSPRQGLDRGMFHRSGSLLPGHRALGIPGRASRSVPRSRSSPPTSATPCRWRRRVPGCTRRASRPRSRRNGSGGSSARRTASTGSTSPFATSACSRSRTSWADPPFSRLDLISCRNVLIYLEPPLQKRVIPMFHYALNPTGFLVLGTSESVGSFSDLFDVVDKKYKIYSKRASAFRQYPHFNVANSLAAVRERRGTAPNLPPRRPTCKRRPTGSSSVNTLPRGCWSTNRWKSSSSVGGRARISSQRRGRRA